MNKKYAATLALTAMVATSLFSLVALADTKAPVTANAPTKSMGMREEGRPGMMRGMGERGMIGTVASVNGSTFTITVQARAKKNDTTTPTSTTYTVDASKATVMKAGATGTISNIAVGDTVMVMGPVTGTNVAAVRVMDGIPKMGDRKEGDEGQAGKGEAAPLFTGNGQPVVAGTVTAVTGNSITITNKSNVTYTVDATTAKIEKTGAVSTVANVAVGDMIVAQGTVNGNAVTAATIMDQGVVPAQPASNGATPPPAPKGFFGKIGGFFGHIFGF